jgi:hypothetical protein
MTLCDLPEVGGIGVKVRPPGGAKVEIFVGAVTFCL